MRTWYYPSDLTDAQWAQVAPHIPAANSGPGKMPVRYKTCNAVVYPSPPAN
jgi:transposase